VNRSLTQLCIIAVITGDGRTDEVEGNCTDTIDHRS
jgi:hypothetical protein